MNKSAKKNIPEFRLDCMAMDVKLPEYDGLKDSNLAAFFSNKNRRKLLCKQKLISREGYLLHPRQKPRNQYMSQEDKPAKMKRSSSKNPKVEPLSKDKFQSLISQIRKESDSKQPRAKTNGEA